MGVHESLKALGVSPAAVGGRPRLVTFAEKLEGGEATDAEARTKLTMCRGIDLCNHNIVFSSRQGLPSLRHVLAVPAPPTNK